MTKIADVVTQIRGVSYKLTDLRLTEKDNAIGILRANNISDDGKVNYDDIVWVDKSKVKENQIIRAGDILICASSGSKALVGKAAQFIDNCNYSFGAFCKVIRPTGANSRYIGYYFQSPLYRQKISSVSAGVNINNIRGEDIDNLNIELPPTEEQEKRVKKLDCIYRAIDIRKKQLRILDDLVKSQFIEMFGKKDYPISELGDVCLFLRNGANIKQARFMRKQTIKNG